MFKRRNLDVESESPLKDSNGQSPSIMSTEEILIGMNSSNTDKNFEAVQASRKMLSRERQPPIDFMINHGIVPKLVRFLDCSAE